MSRFIKRLLPILMVISFGNVVISSPVKADTLSDKEIKKQILIVKKQIPQGAEYRCPQYHKLIKESGLPVQIFSYLMWRESRCQPKVIGWNYKKGKSYKDCRLAPASIYKKCKAISSYDSGLLQINSSWTTVTHEICGRRWGDMTVLLKTKCNIKVAKFLLYNGGGFSNWGFKV